MAYEVSSSVAAGTNYLQLVTNTTGSKSAGGHFSPDGTKLAVPSQRINGSGTDDYGLDIFTSSSLSGWTRTEYIDSGFTDKIDIFQWRSDSEIIANYTSGLYSYTSGASGWSTPVKCWSGAEGNWGSIIFSPNGNRFINAGTNSTYFRVHTTGALEWERGTSVNVANRIQSWAWIDNETIMIGIPEGGPVDNSSHGELLVFQADNAADTSFTQVEQLSGEPGDQLGAAIYYQTSSGNFIVGTDKDRSFTSTQTDLSSSLFVYNSPGGGTYLPADNTGRTEITSSTRTFYGHYVAGERNTDSRAYMLSKNNSGIVNDAEAELIALESGSAGWKVTKIDGQVRLAAVGNSKYTADAPTFISSNGTALVANNSNYTDAAFNVHYVALSTAVDTSLSTTTTSSIGASGGLAKAGNATTDPDVQVNIPAGALAGDTGIILKINSSSDKATAVSDIKLLPSVPKGSRAVSDIVSFEPHGQVFSSPAILSWNVTGSTSNVKVYRRANASSAWAEVDNSYYSFSGGQVHVTSSTFSEYIAIGGISAVAITKIGTKLIGDGTITTVKLGSSAVTRSDIQSGSVQVTHLDVNQGSNGHVDFLDDDFLIAGDATSEETRGFSFSQLKTALSLSNAARGDELTVQYNNGTGFDGISKIRTDGVHLTASDAGKIVLAYTGISGSTGELFASDTGDLTVFGKSATFLHVSNSFALQGNQSASLDITSVGLIPAIKPEVPAQTGIYTFTFTSGSTGGTSTVSTYGPAAQYNAQYLQVASTGSEDYLFFLSDGTSTNKPSANDINMFPSDNVFEIRVEAISGITDWRDVVTNFYNAMNGALGSGGANVATVSYNQTSSVNGTASIEIAYSSIGGGIQVGAARDGLRSLDANYYVGSLNNQSADPSTMSGITMPLAGGDGIGQSPTDRVEAGSNGVTVSSVQLGSDVVNEVRTWFGLGSSTASYDYVYGRNISGSGTTYTHILQSDHANIVKLQRSNSSTAATFISSSTTAYLHNIDVDEATIGGVTLTSVRDAAAYAITGSGTANFHKIDADFLTGSAEEKGLRLLSIVVSASSPIDSGVEVSDASVSGNGTINVSTAITASTGDYFRLDGTGGTYTAVVDTVAGNGLSFTVVRAQGSVSSPYTLASFEEPTKIHNIGSSDYAAIDQLRSTVLSGSQVDIHKMDIDESTIKKVITTNLTSSGLARMHNVDAYHVDAVIGEFQIVSANHVNAGSINSSDDTTEHVEVTPKQLIPAVSQSAGAAQEGAGLQIGGTAGSGSAGIASVVLGDAGSGAGADLLFKIGATQGASLSGSISEGGQRFGVTGSLSASIGVFHDLTINQSMGNQDSIFSGSSVTAHVVSSSTANLHFLNVDLAEIAGVSGSTMTYNTLTGSELNAHRLQVDRSNVTVNINDVDGTTLTYFSISSSTAQAHLFDADIVTVNDLDVSGAVGVGAGAGSFTSGSISGSATASLRKLTTDNISGSTIYAWELGATANGQDQLDTLSVGSIQTADVVKKTNLNNDIVQNDSDAHGGIVFNNGQLSVGWKRRIFSRSSKALINRSQPTQGSGSLYTTCSLSETRMVSGSEQVYFNGLLLTKDNGAQGNPQQGDYTIDYNGGGGLQTGTYRFVFYSGSTGPNTDGEFSAKVYGPMETYIPHLVAVKSTGSNEGEYYLFYLDNNGTSPIPISASINMEFAFPSNTFAASRRHDIPVEAVVSVTDWRDVVTNLYNAMNTELNTNAGLATVSYNQTSSINGTASIEVTYNAGTMTGDVFIGSGDVYKTSTNGSFNSTLSSQLFSPSNSGKLGNGYTNTFGTETRQGGEVEIVVSGAVVQAGTEIFLAESLAMDSDDVLVVQYLSGSHQF